MPRHPERPAVRWRTSSYTGTNNCVEAGSGVNVVLIRDTKDRTGATLTVNGAAWRTFTSMIAVR